MAGEGAKRARPYQYSHHFNQIREADNRRRQVVRAAWAVTTAAASFTWSDLGHKPDDPYFSTQTFTQYPSAAKAIDVLNHIMTEEVPAFFRMEPADELLQKPVPDLTFCLAERGAQYVVYSDAGSPFVLDTAAAGSPLRQRGLNLTWFDPVSGAATAGGSVAQSAATKLKPPGAGKHWVALLA